LGGSLRYVKNFPQKGGDKTTKDLGGLEGNNLHQKKKGIVPVVKKEGVENGGGA